ncbi:MAG: bifunctional serine/threonine-protein kinase/formylglycine-generating enzyme family protein [Rhodoglobus sp.]
MVEGEVFGGYRILGMVGGGGMGTVFLAEHIAMRRRVAIKVINPELLADPRVRERFAREAAAVGKLDHRGICTLYEFGESDGIPYLALRYVEGESLAVAIDKATLARGRGEPGLLFGGAVRPAFVEENSKSSLPTPLASTLALIEEVARALQFAHGHGVVHRDVKPANILIDPSGQPVLLDFGLAKDRDASTMTQTLDLVGTPAYMAPEQVAGYGKRPQPAADVYSLAVTLYECLTLEQPFSAPTRRELFEAILFREPTPIRHYDASLPADLVTVLGRAMEKDSKRRYSTAQEFADELRSVRLGEVIKARRPSVGMRLHRWVRRNRTAVILMVTIGLAAIGTVFAAATVRAQARDLELLATWGILRVAAEEERELYRHEPRAERPERMQAWLDRYTSEASPESLPRRLRLVRDRIGAIELPPVRTMGALGETPEQMKAERDSLARIATRLRGLVATASPDVAMPKELELAFVERRHEWLDLDLRRFESSPTPTVEAGHGSLQDLLVRDLRTLAQGLVLFVEGDPRTGNPERADPLWAKPSAIERVIQARARELEHGSSDSVERERKWLEVRERIGGAPNSVYATAIDLAVDPALEPLGPDPESGLEEFALVHSGRWRIPSRDERRRLQLHDEMPIVFVLMGGGNSEGEASMGTEKPRHISQVASYPSTKAIIEPYLLSKFELTQHQWAMLGGGNPSTCQVPVFGDTFTPRHPVESVTWTRSVEVLSWHELELPTEFQWEIACSGGVAHPIYFEDQGPVKDYENLAKDLGQNLGGLFQLHPFARPDPERGHTMTVPVGSYKANPYGFHDILGNVSEFCADRFGFNFQPVRNGDGLRQVSMWPQRMVRGGCYALGAQLYSRMLVPEDRAVPLIGLRPMRRVRR